MERETRVERETVVVRGPRRLQGLMAEIGVQKNNFDKFTDRARRALDLAHEEALRFNHDYLGTEHLLLGLLRVEEGVAARVLRQLGIDLTLVRQSIEFMVGRGDKPPTGAPVLTPRAKRAIELSLDEGNRLSHAYIGTEHLLLGLIREGEGVAASVLAELGATTARLRAEILRVLTLGRSIDETAATRGNVISCRVDASDLAAIDALVEAGIRGTRSEAAAWLIHTGITTHRSLFEQVNSTVAEIRRLRSEAQAIAEGLTAEGADAAPPPAASEGGQEEPTPPGED